MLVFNNYGHAAFYGGYIGGKPAIYHSSNRGVGYTFDLKDYWLLHNYGTIDVYRPYNSIVDFFRSIIKE